MRSAGCIYNDIIDRDFDAKVRRTATRPLATGELTITEVIPFLVLLLSGAALILLSLPLPAIITGCIALLFVLLYPWMKRLTYWPQLFLGMTFNIGILMGWLSLSPGLSLTPLLFYGGAILWTLGYDTIYGLQDIEDDLMVGVKSSSIAIFSHLKPFLSIVYGGACVLWGVGGYITHLKEPFWISLGLIAAQFMWQIITLQKENPFNGLKRFQSNTLVGILLFLGIVFSHTLY